MSRVAVLLLLVALAFLGGCNAIGDCPLNQVYKTCGSACEPRCGQPPSTYCTAVCVEGCQCKKGYIRNAANQCVLPTQCWNIKGDNK